MPFPKQAAALNSMTLRYRNPWFACCEPKPLMRQNSQTTSLTLKISHDNVPAANLSSARNACRDFHTMIGPSFPTTPGVLGWLVEHVSSLRIEMEKVDGPWLTRV
jgi:hypothetical protein